MQQKLCLQEAIVQFGEYVKAELAKQGVRYFFMGLFGLILSGGLWAGWAYVVSPRLFNPLRPVGEAVAGAKEVIVEGAASVREKTRDAVEATKEKVGNAKDIAVERASATREKVDDLKDRAREKFDNVRDRFRRKDKETDD